MEKWYTCIDIEILFWTYCNDFFFQMFLRLYKPIDCCYRPDGFAGSLCYYAAMGKCLFFRKQYLSLHVPTWQTLCIHVCIVRTGVRILFLKNYLFRFFFLTRRLVYIIYIIYICYVAANILCRFSIRHILTHTHLHTHTTASLTTVFVMRI